MNLHIESIMKREMNAIQPAEYVAKYVQRIHV
jgi:hypothetical protein